MPCMQLPFQKILDLKKLRYDPPICESRKRCFMSSLEELNLLESHQLSDSSLSPKYHTEKLTKKIHLLDGLDTEDDDDSDADLSLEKPRLLNRSLSAAPFKSERTNSIHEMIDFDNFKKSMKRAKTTNLDRPSQAKGLLMFLNVILMPLYIKTWFYKLPVSLLIPSLLLYIFQFICYYMLLAYPKLQEDDITYFETRFPILLLFLVAWVAGHCRAVSSVTVNTSSPSIKQIQRFDSNSTLVSAFHEEDSSDDDDNDFDDETGEESEVYESEADHRRRPKSTPGRLSSSKIHRLPVENSNSVAIRAVMWTGSVLQKEVMQVSDIRKKINSKVEAANNDGSYTLLAQSFAVVLACIPLLFRFVHIFKPILCGSILMSDASWMLNFVEYNRLCAMDTCDLCEPSDWNCATGVMRVNFDDPLVLLKMSLTVVSMLSTMLLAGILFHHAACAEDAFRRRLSYVKYFSKLTSYKRAKKIGLPHFRLNKVKHIRGWLELRHDTSSESNSRVRFGDGAATVLQMVTMSVLGYSCIRLFTNLWDPSNVQDWVIMFWAVFMSVFLFRLMDLAGKTNKKFKTNKILYTEQLNMYIRIFSNPSNREELMACNNMIKIAIKLIKEVDGGGGKDKVQALLLNPVVYNLFRITILSAIGTASSDLFGFKVRLWKL